MNEKYVVIKYGGSIFDDKGAAQQLFAQIANLHKEGNHLIIVHGGGKAITEEIQKRGVDTEFVAGRRKTSLEVLNVAKMVLSGEVGKSIAQQISQCGVDAISLDGRDGRMIEAKKKDIFLNDSKIDIGYVGEVTNVKVDTLLNLLSASIIPVIAPIAVGDDCEYNINADEMAAAIAIALKAELLIFMTDVEGVYGDYENKTSLYKHLSIEETDQLITDGIINGGMLPKVESCLDCVKQGVNKVTIVSGNNHLDLKQLLDNEASIGTTFTK